MLKHGCIRLPEDDQYIWPRRVGDLTTKEHFEASLF